MQTINVNGCVYEIGEHGAAVLTECVQGGPVVALPTAVDGHPLTGIDHDAFDHTGPITAFQAEAGHPAFSCRDGVLFDRSGEYLLRYPPSRAADTYAVPSGTREIGIGAFAGASALREVSLPEGLVQVGDRAFSECGALKSISLPASLKRLGHEAFRGSLMMSGIALPARHPFLRVEGCFLTDRAENTLLLCLPGRGETELTAPEGIRYVDDCAFYGCGRLERIHLHHGLRTLGRYAFYHCRSLKSADLPDGLRSIGSRAFSGCGELRSLYIPDSVTSIEYKAFNNCEKLVLQVNKGSYADRYCRQFGYPCHHRHHWPWQKE